MNIGNISSGLGGLLGAFEKQREGVEQNDNVSVQNTPQTAMDPGLEQGDKTRELARAVTGVGTKVDVDV